MTSLAVPGFTWFLVCLIMSEAGALSPPQRLRVNLLDFEGNATWDPGLSCPSGTRYSLELLNLNHYSNGTQDNGTLHEWKKVTECTNISSTSCHLSFKEEDILDDFFVRVKAICREQSSIWMTLPHTIQPYGTSVISAPSLWVALQQRTIEGKVTHPLKDRKEYSNLRFSIHLYIKTANQIKEVANVEKDSNFSFSDLQSEHEYCVRATVIHHQQQSEHHFAQKCITVPKYSVGTAQPLVGGVLLILPLGICFAVIWCFKRPWIKNTLLPKTLRFGNTGFARVQTLSHVELQALSISIPDGLDNTEVIPSSSDEEESIDSPHSYQQRVNLISVVRTSSEIYAKAKGDEAEEVARPLHVTTLYSLALDMEDLGSNEESEEQHRQAGEPSAKLNISKLLWKVHVCHVDDDKDWHLALDSDTPGKPGGQSRIWSDYSGHQSKQQGSIEEKINPLMSPVIISDYEPRPDILSHCK